MKYPKINGHLTQALIDEDRVAVEGAKSLRMEWSPGGDATAVSLVAVAPDGSERVILLVQRVAVTVVVGQETQTEIAYTSLEGG